MSLAVDLRTFLAAGSAIGALVTSDGVARIHQGHVPEGTALPFVWFAQVGAEWQGTLGGSAGEAPFSRSFDLECVSDDLGEAADLAEAVRSRLSDYRGTFGASEVQGVFCEDHSEDYQPRAADPDYGEHAQPLRVMIIPR